MAEKDIGKTTPDSVDAGREPTSPADGPLFATEIPPAPSNKPAPIVWIGMGGLVIVALFVVFVLPSIVSEYELPLERRADATPVSNGATSNSTTAISPFQEAQRSIQRKEAQDVLAELLDIQRQLDEKQVDQWGQVDYSESLAQASIGDEYYRSQDFILAAESYAAARDRLVALNESIPTVLSQTLIDAEKALLEGNASVASQKFQLALVLDPDNEAARIGSTRAATLDEVRSLLETADDQLRSGELEQARSNYRAALSLDSFNDYARQQISAVSARITENEFARIMSSGYALLESGEPEQAITAFERAAAIGINQDQASAAIVQAENEIANAEITRLRAAIFTAETTENWQQAVNLYDQVLAIDANLVFAIEGRDYAAKRAQLDRLLVSAIANPERFSEPAVFEETRDVYFTGRAIEPAGTKLQQQLDELQTLLENSQIPVEIRLVSDNRTDVTVLRVGSLGVFEETSLSLKPGVYVAIGKREGYREVREEFTVGFGRTPDAVVVRCDEPVVASTRR